MQDTRKMKDTLYKLEISLIQSIRRIYMANLRNYDMSSADEINKAMSQISVVKDWIVKLKHMENYSNEKKENLGNPPG